MEMKNWTPFFYSVTWIVVLSLSFLYTGDSIVTNDSIIKVITLLLIIFIFITEFISSFWFVKLKDKRKKKVQEVYGIVTRRFIYGTIIHKDELLRLYEDYHLEKVFDTFASFLDSYLAYLLKYEDPRIQYYQEIEDSEGKVQYKTIEETLSSFITEERKVKPYEGVNERERKLLQDIEIAAERNEQTAVKSSLEYLANAIIENQKIYSKENRLNNRMTIIGVIITIIGLIATILVFIIQQNHSLTSRDVKKDMIEVVDSCVVVDTNGVSGYHLQSNNIKRPIEKDDK